MRKRLQLVLAFALVAATACVLPATAAAPRVWLASESPLAVRGTGFHPQTRITVTVAKAKQSFRKTTSSGVAGGFVARFSVRLSTRCGTVVVIADDGQRLPRRMAHGRERLRRDPHPAQLASDFGRATVVRLIRWSPLKAVTACATPCPW